MPQIYFEKVKSFCNADIFFWHIKESCEDLSVILADDGLLLAKAQQRFKSVSRQCEWLAVRALLQQTPYKNEKILYQSNGKPFFAKCGKHISISHSRCFVAVAVSESPIGIDIESLDRNALAVASSFLQPHEMEILSVGSNSANEALLMWSAKEAAFKLASDKVSVLKEIGITKNANNYTIIYPDGVTAKCNVSIFDDFVLAVAQ